MKRALLAVVAATALWLTAASSARAQVYVSGYYDYPAYGYTSYYVAPVGYYSYYPSYYDYYGYSPAYSSYYYRPYYSGYYSRGYPAYYHRHWGWRRW
jgi:hypothetical protein